MLKSYKIKDWKILGNQNDYDLESDARFNFPVQIGEVVESGQPSEPVVEYIYSDVYMRAIEGTLSTSVSMGRIPAVVFKENGRVIDHNDNMQFFREDIEGALASVPVALQLKALVTSVPLLAVNATLPKQCPAMDVVMLVNAQTGTKFNADLVIDTLKNKVSNDIHFQSPLKDELRTLNRNDLLDLVGAIKTMKVCGESRSPQLTSLLQKYEKFDVFMEVAWEVADRELMYGRV
jgi:hypothetical protein